ncbi:MAG: hypothetical protein EOP56_18220 [Sphingobacteriales bacterium]|nr:MAG: hypothetical protein EOP56_18220 [Sphingobacteriales bacterium]
MRQISIFGKPLHTVIAIVTLSILCFSCKSRHRETNFSDYFTTSKFDEDDFAEALYASYKGKEIDSAKWDKKKTHSTGEILHYTYHYSEYLPLWVGETGGTDPAEKLIKELEGMQADGINPELYKMSALKKQLAAFKKESEPDLNAIIALDTACTIAYIEASHDLLLGVVDPKKADNQWFHTNDTAWRPETPLLVQLNDLGKYPELKQFRSTVPTYGLLMKAREHYITLAKDAQFKNVKTVVATNPADSVIRIIVAKELQQDLSNVVADSGKSPAVLAYQQYYGIIPTGKLDTSTKRALTRQPEEIVSLIDANLERLRWMPKDMASQYIIVNVPQMELFLRRGGRDVMHMNVVVGKPARETPSLNSDMEHVVFNPPWGVPPTILKQDVLPGIERAGEAYLAKKDLEVFDLKGRRVDASMVNASNYKSFVFRQPPGDDNALGYVKFNMPNRWNIYLHDTPHREDFDKPYRAKSSGCIRLQQPQEMAEYILTQIEKRDFDQSKISGIISTQTTKYEKLKTKLPVHIVYLTAFEDMSNKRIRFSQDIYKRDDKLVDMLKSKEERLYAKK